MVATENENQTGAASVGRDPGDPAAHPNASARDAEVDWIAAEESPEFKELVAARRRFVLPGTVFFFAAYFGFVLLSGYAGGFMGASVYRGLTVGYVFMLGLFAMVWVMVYLYLKKADNVFDPLARRAAARAVQTGGPPTRSVSTDGTGSSDPEERSGG